jgi:hypothetical protein
VADPSKLDFSDWFSVVVASLLTGMGGAMAWFSGSKRRMHTKIAVVEEAMSLWHERHAKHSTDIAVIQTCQENTAQQLEAISVTTRDTNENLKELGQTVTQVLLAIQAKK